MRVGPLYAHLNGPQFHLPERAPFELHQLVLAWFVWL